MAKDPAFLFYPSDFNDGTQDFTNEEVGAYIRLLLFQFSQGHLPLDRIKRKLGSDFDSLWPMLSQKFQTDEDGLFYNARLDAEVSKRKAFSESRRKNVSKRYEKEVNNESSTYVSTSVVHMENENENRNTNENTDKTKVKKPKKEASKPEGPVHPLQNWIKQNCPRVAKLDKQLTYEQAEKIASEFDREQIINKLLAMENKRKLDYVSVNLTLRNWLIKDQNNPAIPGFSNFQTEPAKNPRSRP